MTLQYWLIKSEPFKYSFAQLQKEGKACWDGVRNFEARNYMRMMKTGDFCLFYHSSEGKEVVGVTKVVVEAYLDPSGSPEEDWSAIDIAPVIGIKVPVALDLMRTDSELAGIAIVKRPRLSVVPLSKEHFERILLLGKTKIPKRKK